MDQAFITTIVTAVAVALQQYEDSKRHQATRATGLMATDTDQRGVQQAPPVVDTDRTLVAVPSPVTMTAAEQASREVDAEMLLNAQPTITVVPDSGSETTIALPSVDAAVQQIKANPLAASVTVGPAGQVVEVSIDNIVCAVPPFKQGDIRPCPEIGQWGYWVSRTDQIVDALCVGKLANGKRVFRMIGVPNKKTGQRKGKAILMSRTLDSVSWGSKPASQTTTTATKEQAKVATDVQARTMAKATPGVDSYSAVRVNGALAIPAGRGTEPLFLFQNSDGSCLVDPDTGYYQWVSARSAKGKLAAAGCHRLNERAGASSYKTTIKELRALYNLPV